MKLSCVIRNIPNSEPKNLIANGLRMTGVHTRKRGRGARARPYGYTNHLGYRCYAGGEYQDLPIHKAARFSMYFDAHYIYPRMHFDYVGIADNGKMRIRLSS